MAFDKIQFRELVVDVLKKYNLHSDSAVNLLLGTCAQESKFGTYLKQLGKGPALSIFQIEKVTFEDLKGRYKSRFPFLANITFPELRWNLEYAIIVARIKYYSIPSPLPGPTNVKELAKYWKMYYNTVYGDGTVEQFIENYAKYVK